MVGRQLPIFSVIVPFWLIAGFEGFAGIRRPWPVLLVAGVSFAMPQFVVANFVGPTLVDVIAGVVSTASVVVFVKLWRPAAAPTEAVSHKMSATRAWIPWGVLCVLVLLAGLPPVKGWLNHLYAPPEPPPPPSPPPH